ncbi:12578_t:CDS:2 [Dentiscutata erythropus]|uniref:12578_t:CDS:1 n=1 Tax=Dentiscutata erythropus TaxID=1348616 RepID=A0A9N9A3K5_9GLOM|nr:12578_t:CDS:2 [Dentiscutata erythropus]
MALSPAIGLVALTKVVVQDLQTIYENAQCNQYIAKILLDRTKTAEYFLDLLSRNEDHGSLTKIIIQETVDIYEKVDIYENIQCNKYTSVKNFAEKVTQFRGIKKYWNANNVRRKFDSLMKEYDGYMNDLNTTVTITIAIQNTVDMKRIEREFEKIDKLNEEIDLETREEYINYLKLSANNGHGAAQYKLGDHYLSTNKEIALKYLNLAAAQNNNNAKEKLKILR